jgi:molybdopterin/thiamine biosynthesis adenylyltransferase
VILNALLVAEVSPLLVAVSVYPVPDLLMLQPANVATPEEAANGFVVQVSVPLLGVSVIKAELLVTVLPAPSSTVTFGCIVQAVPPVPPPGCVVKTSLLAVNVTVAVCEMVTLSVVSLAV